MNRSCPLVVVVVFLTAVLSAMPLSASEPTPSLHNQAPAEIRLPIRGGQIGGFVALKGGRVEDLALLTPQSPQAVSFPYFIQSNWLSPTARPFFFPQDDTVWTIVDGTELTVNSPVILAWDGGQGLHFLRKIALDGDLTVAITDRVDNNSDSVLPFFHGARLERVVSPSVRGFYIPRQETPETSDALPITYPYEEVRGEEMWEGKLKSVIGGSLGIADKDRQLTLIPDQNADVTIRFVAYPDGDHETYMAGYAGGGGNVAVGGWIETTTKLILRRLP